MCLSWCSASTVICACVPRVSCRRHIVQCSLFFICLSFDSFGWFYGLLV
jgi:hypothetical protein